MRYTLRHGLPSLARRPVSSHWRSMSITATSTLHKFVVFAPDRTDEGCLQRRLKVRPAHLERAKELTEMGKIKIGGALLTPDSIASANAEKKMIGSMMIIEAETIDEVKALVKSDIYYTGEVWDPEQLVITPFVPAAL